MDIPNWIFNFKTKHKYGTGFLVDLDNPDIDMILTASHCLEDEKKMKINDSNKEEIEFIEKDIKVIHVWTGTAGFDAAALFIKKVDRSALNIPPVIWEIGRCMEIFSGSMFGFPHQKVMNEMNTKLIDVKNIFIDDKSKNYKGTLSEFKEGSETDKTFLLQGMSGAPLFTRENDKNVLFGLYTGAEHKDVAYDDVSFIPIEKILLALRNDEEIYYPKFTYNNGIKKIISDSIADLKQDRSINFKKSNKLEFILIGESESGKSSFINSFLMHADYITSIGKGITTRINCEYNIYCHQVAHENKVSIEFLNEKSFVERRLWLIDAKLKSLLDRESIDRDEISELILDNNAFFSISELDFSGNEISAKVRQVFNTIFPSEVIASNFTHEKMSELRIQFGEVEDQNEDKNNSEDLEDGKRRNLIDLVSIFYKQAYKIIESLIEIKLTKKEILLNKNLSSDDQKFIECCLKTSRINEKKCSYTGLVSKVIVHDRICDEYIDLLQNLNIESIKFIDTFGLNHDAAKEDAVIISRLEQLFSGDYPNIKNALYIRGLDAGAPADLEYYLPMLYSVDANVVLNVVFTKVDKDESFKRKFQQNINVNLFANDFEVDDRESAVIYFERQVGSKRHKLERAMINSKYKVSEELAKCMFDTIVKRLTPYCATNDEEDYIKYFDNNFAKLKSLFRSIIDREHLGSEKIEIKKIEEHMSNSFKNEKSELLMTLDKLIKRMCIEAQMIDWDNSGHGRGHWKTQDANIKRLQKKELGYYGVLNNTWSYKFKKGFNKVFACISQDDFKNIFGIGSISKQGSSIQMILNQSITKFIGCQKYDYDQFPITDSCYIDCKYSANCFKQILLKSYSAGELERECNNRVMWLRERCNFGKRYDKINNILVEYFKNQLLGSLIEELGAHNRKILAQDLQLNFHECIYKLREELSQHINSYENLRPLEEYSIEITNDEIKVILKK